MRGDRKGGERRCKGRWWSLDADGTIYYYYYYYYYYYCYC